MRGSEGDGAIRLAYRKTEAYQPVRHVLECAHAGKLLSTA
ncbi:hypothetical protein SEA_BARTHOLOMUNE_250 [Streptomyces phage Bartholomune]|nr:hypothetical protein SEA_BARTHOLOMUNE_250 [Streptomyces phage Bartholomune]